MYVVRRHTHRQNTHIHKIKLQQNLREWRHLWFVHAPLPSQLYSLVISSIAYWLYFTGLWQNSGQNMPQIFYLLIVVSFVPVMSPVVSCTWTLIPSLWHGIREGWAGMIHMIHYGNPLKCVAVFASDCVLYYIMCLPCEQLYHVPTPMNTSHVSPHRWAEIPLNPKAKTEFPPWSYC